MIAFSSGLCAVAILVVEDESPPVLPIAAPGAFDNVPSAQQRERSELREISGRPPFRASIELPVKSSQNVS